MAEYSGIEWTDATFNPWWGCTKVSVSAPIHDGFDRGALKGGGCDNCYAERDSKRFGQEWGAGTERRFFGDKHWNEPLRWNRKAEKAGVPMKVFCASFADVFDNEVGQEHRDRLWALVKATPWLRWLILTKRVGNVPRMLPADWGDGYPNAALGITVVTQPEAERDITKLMKIPAVCRFLSLEPLLGRIDLRRCLYGDCAQRTRLGSASERLPACCEDPAEMVPIDWVITGGESGHNARVADLDWYRYLRDQCVVAGVPFFFKQHGEWAQCGPIEPDAEFDGGAAFQSASGARTAVTCIGSRRYAKMGERVYERVGKHEAGRLLDGETYSQFPKWATT